jgi:Shikimate kinase
VTANGHKAGTEAAPFPLIILIGPPGSGKTTVGSLLAARLGVGFTDTDAVIEAAAGKPVGDIFISDGEPEFRRLEREAVAIALADSEARGGGLGSGGVGGGGIGNGSTRAGTPATGVLGLGGGGDWVRRAGQAGRAGPGQAAAHRHEPPRAAQVAAGPAAAGLRPAGLADRRHWRPGAGGDRCRDRRGPPGRQRAG